MSVSKFKVCLLGEGRVGKTSILLRFTKNEFRDGELPTDNGYCAEKIINIAGMPINLALWDTAGQEKYHALAPIFYRGARGFVLVYDITDIQSFIRVKTWVKELHKDIGTECLIIIVGNKIDSERSRNVDEAEAVK
jgi:Ras-related protein Rab-21